jgi:hypothetical protein
VRLTLYNDTPSCAPAAAQFSRERILAKLEAIDAKARRKGLESLDPARSALVRIGMEAPPGGPVTKNVYGVFHLSWLARTHPEWPETVLEELDAIRARLRETHGVKLKFLIWAGMGGSAEDKPMYAACGLLRKGPKVYVLDSTDPAKLKAILEDMQRRSKGSLAAALKSTLVVGMAMGMTSYEPVVNLEKLSALYQRHGIASQPNFVYMTLPGSLLDRFAGPRGYRKAELQMDGGNSTAGRHSAPLTRGSLYPLGLAGVDLKQWIEGTFLSEEEVLAAWTLSAFLDTQGKAGRGKVTLALSRSLAGAALWTKQNFEESLGKSEELGIKIVIGEPLKLAQYREPKSAAQDRCFLIVERRGEQAVNRNKLPLLKRAGYPVAVVSVPRDAPLSRYMQFIHYAVFGAAWLRQMNFVTQPSVELYKSITSPLYDNAVLQGGIENTAEWKQLKDSPRQIRWRGGVTLHYDRMPCAVQLRGRDAAGALASLLQQLAGARAIEYGELTLFGDTRYARQGRRARLVLDRAADRVFRARLKMPADVYEGPAMNHSYHEMIIGHGRCLSIVLLPEKAASIPEAGYTADYHRAQFLATQMALERRGRLVVSLTLRDLEDGSLKALEEYFREVAARLKR